MTKITKDKLSKIIEAADGVLSSVAGTNEDVHKDDCVAICRLWDSLNDYHAPPEVVREMARLLLAGMQQEPVARRYRYQNGPWLYKHIGDNGAGTDGYVEQLLYAAPQPLNHQERAEIQEYRKAAGEPVAWILTGIDGRKSIECNKTVIEMFSCFIGNKVEPLYTTPQPAPAVEAVPDERVAFNAWNNDADCPLAGLTVKQAAWLAWLKRSGVIKYFEPVTDELPGWIKCSDRMPPQGEPLLICSSGGVVQRAIYGFDGENWLDWQENYDPVKAERCDLWMPLPAAPQQEDRK